MSCSRLPKHACVSRKRSMCIPWILLLLVIAYPMVLDAPEEWSRLAETPRTDIRTLRAEGRYAEALGVARHTVENCTKGRYSESYRMYWIPHYERLAATLEYLDSLPRSAQHEMAEADSLTVEMHISWTGMRPVIGEDQARRRLEIQRRHLREPHHEIAGTLHELARFMHAQYKETEAESLYHEALAMRVETLGRKHHHVARTLEFLGALQAGKGDRKEAEKLLREALQIIRETVGEGAQYNECTLRIANLFMEEGDYARAETALRSALALNRVQRIGERIDPTWITGTILNNLACCLANQGDHASAESLHREALAVRRQVLEPDHPHITQSLSALALALHAKGDLDAAEPLYREALAAHQEYLGDDPSTAWILNNLARLLGDKGDLATAESLHHEALAMNRRVVGDRDPEVASCLVHLAHLKMQQGEYAEAEDLFGQALEIERGFNGKDNPAVGRLLHRLSQSLMAQGRHNEAEQQLLEATGIFETARLQAGRGFARATFQNSPYSMLAATRLELGKSDTAWPAAEKALGRALSDLIVSSRQRSLGFEEIAHADSLQNTLTELEGQVQALAEVSEPDSLGQACRELRELRTKLAAAEAAWSLFQQDVALDHPVTEGQPLTLDRIQAALDEQSALIGWLHVDVGRDGSDIGPWGYVIRDTGPVRWIRLRPKSSKPDTRAKDAPNAFREALALAGSWPFRVTEVERINVAAHEVWAQWMQPLTPHLEGVGRVAVIPSGPMCSIPLEALRDAEGVLFGDRFAVSYVPSASLYAWLKEESEGHEARPGRKALLVGDPPFTADHLAAMENERAPGRPVDEDLLACADFTLEPSILRSALAGNDEVLGSLPRLPRAREEVERVASAIVEATTLVGPEASEQELVSLARAGSLREYDTVHLATHALVDGELPERSALVLSLVNLPDPLEAVMKGGRVYDGLLTMKEIVRDWELDADLVTLSGCQTALGREVAGEGSVGLAHAFLQVGARSLLVSLWRVEDEATSLLMGRFYENLTGAYRDERAGAVGEPMTKAAALQEAKRWLRTYTDDQGRQPFKHPIYWSGFVLIGGA